MVGPVGVARPDGAVPRARGIVRHMRLDGVIHMQGAPEPALSATCETCRALPLETSAIQRVNAVSDTRVKAMRLLSGAQDGLPIFALDGTAIRLSVPGARPAIGRKRRPVYLASRDPALLRGLRLRPASRASGAATSAMPGSPGRSRSRSNDRSG